jgi:hypothetical protein
MARGGSPIGRAARRASFSNATPPYVLGAAAHPQGVVAHHVRPLGRLQEHTLTAANRHYFKTASGSVSYLSPLHARQLPFPLLVIVEEYRVCRGNDGHCFGDTRQIAAGDSDVEFR